VCIFCEIVKGSAPAYLVHEDAESLAFLDARPLFPGHTLLVPKEHHETLADLPPKMIDPLFSMARRLSIAVVEAVGAEGTFVAMNNKISQSVPHLHVHVVPRRPKDGLRGFFWPRQRYEDENHAQEVATAVGSALRRTESR
jgi:histidine triad (HIT) family protein